VQQDDYGTPDNGVTVSFALVGLRQPGIAEEFQLRYFFVENHKIIPMKKIILLILLLHFIIYVKGQEIPIQQLLAMQKQDLNTVNKYLKIKKFDWFKNSEKADGKMASVSWTYGREFPFKGSSNYRSIAWIWYNYEAPFPNRICYQYSKLSYYNATVVQLKQLGFILKETLPDGESGGIKQFMKTSIIELKYLNCWRFRRFLLYVHYKRNKRYLKR